MDDWTIEPPVASKTEPSGRLGVGASRSHAAQSRWRIGDHVRVRGSQLVSPDMVGEIVSTLQHKNRTMHRIKFDNGVTTMAEPDMLAPGYFA